MAADQLRGLTVLVVGGYDLRLTCTDGMHARSDGVLAHTRYSDRGAVYHNATVPSAPPRHAACRFSQGGYTRLRDQKELRPRRLLHATRHIVFVDFVKRGSTHALRSGGTPLADLAQAAGCHFSQDCTHACAVRKSAGHADCFT